MQKNNVSAFVGITNTKVFYLFIHYINYMLHNKLIEIDEDFDKEKAYKKEINDGFIKCIYLEDDNWDSTLGVSDDNTEATLQTAGNALIEFANGKHLFIKNSEWCNLYFI